VTSSVASANCVQAFKDVTQVKNAKMVVVLMNVRVQQTARHLKKLVNS
jgi:hypothetical protein